MSAVFNRKSLFIASTAAVFSVVAFLIVSAASVYLLPVSDGNYTQWTPSTGSTHYTLVDETSCNGTTDYVSTATTGNRDSYGLDISSIPNGYTITKIEIKPCASRNSNGGGSSTMNVFYRWNGANSSDAGSYALTGTTPAELATTTFSSLSLSKGAGSTLEIGAVYTSGTKGARLSRIRANVTYQLNRPAAPSNLSGTVASSTQINLTWTDNSDNESNFELLRKIDSGSFLHLATTSADVTSYNDAGLSVNKTYEYQVRAYNSVGYSSTTSSGSLTTTFPAPSSVSAVGVSSSQIDLTWTDNTTDEYGFVVYRATSQFGTYSTVATTSMNIASYSDTSASSDVYYYYKIRAYNVGGYSLYSNIDWGIAASAVPSDPSSLTASSTTSTTLAFTWTDNSSNEENFRIERSDNGVDFTEIITTTFNVTGYTDTGLTPNTTYYYRVRASNFQGNSGYTNTLSMTTNP